MCEEGYSENCETNVVEEIDDPKERSSFLEAALELANNGNLDIPHKEALAYLVWDDGEMNLMDKVEALEAISESIAPNSTDYSCLFSPSKSLRSYLRSYCKQARLLCQEVLDSVHGIDFYWKLVEPKSVDNGLEGFKSLSCILLADDDAYGELELCLNAAISEQARSEYRHCLIMITAQYWLNKEILIDLLFSKDGVLLGIRSGSSDKDSCAFLLSHLKVASDVSKAHWRKMREAKSKAKAVAGSDASLANKEKVFKELSTKIPDSRINPISDIKGNRRLEASRDSYYSQYAGIINAFYSANFFRIRSELREVESTIAQLRSAAR